MSISSEYQRLLKVISKSQCAVAFSGGVDSSLALKAAVDVFGHSTVAFFADSVLQPPGELENAKKIASLIGCDLKIIRAEPLSWAELVHNPSDRCYHCKKKIYTLFLDSLSDSEHVLVDGSNLDDLSEYRPGRKAISELGVHTPLIEAKLGKDAIRKIARSLSLPNWDKISASCLATRLPSGMALTEKRLDLVAKCESELHRLGFYGCRVRLIGGRENEIKLEVVKNDLEKFSDKILREDILKALCQYGIKKICLDISGR